ncbi:hypothetical protein BKA67DRAFT_664345 [Truncatella angustata]|uniref:Nephrocystin 3-like N-terminal domain-containing protein n=1 Tax=Truncatella angustata TaxID=152316 RepID=A0A9P8RLK3_9PEZI|nr:uncharacterized protein BKA67DRAFT_664345 [Truncatella angustata]KAH6646513.1 hypothetical protein BKA67DRAFT_664345 [Truncatella angustata]
MLSTITDALPQYGELIKLWSDKSHASHDPADTNIHKVLQHIGEVYQDIFQILHFAARVFTKSDGKRKPVVVVETSIWKPFESPSNDTLRRMAGHRRFILEQLVIWHASDLTQDMTRAAADREIHSAEFNDAAEERQLAETERALTRKERERYLENKRLPKDIQEMIRSLSNSRKVEGTALWFLENPSYINWKGCKSEALPTKTQFGGSALWAQGNPGAGKTVIAATVINEPIGEYATSSRSNIFYYFFDHQSPSSRRSSDAYGSILAQLLWKERRNPQI